jgi:hypothetical protein
MLVSFSLYVIYIDIYRGTINSEIKCIMKVNIIDSGADPPANDIVGIDCDMLNRELG